jgi:transposase
MSDILDLDGWTLLTRTQEDGWDVLEAEYRPQPDTCPKCGTVDDLYRHGTKPTTYLDIPIRGAPARLKAKVQRFQCRSCKGTFLQPLGGIRDDRRMTLRCANYIQARCLMDTFVRIAEDVGCDDKTVRNLAWEYIASLDERYRPELPEWLGIDETQIAKVMRLVLTDVGNRRVIDMLETRNKDTLARWLRQFPSLRVVKGIATDMWRPYRDIAHHMLPGVPVVVDKFHVVRMANYCMERVRIRLQKKRVKKERALWLQSKHVLNRRNATLKDKDRLNLDIWLANEPELAAAYALKEAFYAIYDLPKAKAAAAFDAYPATVPPMLKHDFKVLLTAMKNWRTEILAYFDHPITNAYTEAVNGVAKVINRSGRGYSFEVLRARLLFGGKAKPEDQTWFLTYQNTSTGKAMAVMASEQDYHCGVCWTRRDRGEDTRLALVRLARGKAQKTLMVCHGCLSGFHTMGLVHERARSTQQSG